MAKFLNTRKAVSEIDDLIRNAEQTLILISPYLKLSKDFRDLLTYRNRKEKVTTIIFREETLKIDELLFLESLRLVKLKSNESLHAKCYVNDDKMIITSLNLYEFSMANNKEMGVLIEKSNVNDRELFNEAFKEIDYIKETSIPFDYSKKIDLPLNKSTETKDISIKISQIDNGKNKKTNDSNIKGEGHCIRCNNSIKLNPLVPYCKDCYNIWKKDEDFDYKEKYCHICGKNGPSTMIKPACSSCYKANKNKLEFNL